MKLIFSFVLLYHILLVQCAPASMHPNGKLSYEENKILQQKCGHFDVNSAQKSINSERVQRNVAPWVVAVTKDARLKFSYNSTSAHCSGTLISSRHVLSARHCLLESEGHIIWKEAFGGEKNVINATAKDGTLIQLAKDKVFYEVSTNLQEFRFVFHNECGSDLALGIPTQCTTENATVRKAVKAFSPNTRLRDFTIGGSDLLIFELDEPLEKEQNIYPSCLADRVPSILNVLDLYSFGRDGKEGKKSNVGMLQHITITTIPCFNLNTTDVICTRSDTQKAFGGDSGGGYISNNNGTNYVTAVVSGASRVTPSFFDQGQTAVAPHLDWICEHVGICVEHANTLQIRPEIEIIAIR